ncbi:MAG: 30S ribosomal protein S16 [Patescibacteria group bacterium]|jgi:small subunit ribosomal protein S16
MLRIRLARRGQKHQPTYRLVVAEHTRPTTGKFVEILGHYIPTTKPKVFEVKKDRVLYWIERGAQPTDTVHNLLVDAGVLTDKRDIRYAKEKIEEDKAEKVEKVEDAAKDTVPEEVPEESVDNPVEDATEEKVEEATEEVVEPDANQS